MNKLENTNSVALTYGKLAGEHGTNEAKFKGLFQHTSVVAVALAVQEGLKVEYTTTKGKIVRPHECSIADIGNPARWVNADGEELTSMRKNACEAAVALLYNVTPASHGKALVATLATRLRQSARIDYEMRARGFTFALATTDNPRPRYTVNAKDRLVIPFGIVDAPPTRAACEKDEDLLPKFERACRTDRTTLTGAKGFAYSDFVNKVIPSASGATGTPDARNAEFLKVIDRAGAFALASVMTENGDGEGNDADAIAMDERTYNATKLTISRLQALCSFYEANPA